MQANNIVYLTHPYDEQTPSYGGKDGVRIETQSSIESGDTANTSAWSFSNNHIGTHVDVPYHFSKDGKKLLDYSPGEWLYNKISVIDVPCTTAKLIEIEDLNESNISSDVELLLIRTGYESLRSDMRYWNDNPGLSKKLPDDLRCRYPNLRAIGFDFISVTSWKYRQVGRECHKALLSPQGIDKRPIIAIEDMSLAPVSGTIKWALVSPLLFTDGNGAPVTVFAELEG